MNARLFLAAALICAAMSSAAISSAAAENVKAPFGLTWGMQVADLKAAGITIHSTSTTGDLTVVNAKEVPGAFDNTYLVTMLFDRQLGLVKVRWVGTNVQDDATGRQGRASYAEMKKFVTETYGSPTDETMVVGARLFDQDDEFYQCLSYEGCGVWSAIWEQQPSGGVLLSIEGLGAGKGFVQVDFESSGWQEAVTRAQ
ncbi:MAG: hypothetical protein WCF16_09130 [Alphaproteobacteria bacterium]